MRSVEGTRPRSVPRQVLAVLAKVLTGVIIASALVTAGGLAIAHLRGEQVLTVVSGSMTPSFRAGDAVVVSPPGTKPLRPGQVIAFRGGAGATLTTHRIIAVQKRADGDYLQTKGDANPTPDPEWQPVGNVVGVLRSKLSRAGYWLALYQSRQGRLLFVALPLLLLGAGQLNSMRRRRAPVAAEPAVTSTVTAATLVAVAAITLSGMAALRPTAAVYATGAPVAANQFSTGSFCGSASSYGTVISADSPQVWYRFNESSGSTALNSGSSSADGNYLGTTDLGLPGAIRCSSATASGFDGSSTYVSDPVQDTNPNTFSLEVWFRTSSLQGGRLIGFGSSQTGSSSQSDRQIYLDDSGHVVFGVEPAAKVTAISTGTYNDGQWHLADATLGPSGMRLYVDGVLADSSPSTKTGGNYSGYWRVGYDSVAGWAAAPSSFHFQGTLDEAAIYPTVLSAGQVAAHFAANHT